MTIPRKGYAKFDAVFTFQITWTPSNPTGAEDVNDEVLTVNGPDGSDEGDTAANEVGSSDGSTTTETVVAHNLAPGTYHALACGFVNSTPQDYHGTLTVQTVARSATASLRVRECARSRVLRVRPGRPAARRGRAADRDRPRRPHLHLRADRLLGRRGLRAGLDRRRRPVPPPRHAAARTAGSRRRRRLRARDRRDEERARPLPVRIRRSRRAVRFRDVDVRRTTATASRRLGADANGGITSNGAAADRQWMTFLDDHTVLLSWNQQAPRNVVVQTLDRRRSHLLADHVDRCAGSGVPGADALHPVLRRRLHAVDEGRAGEPRRLARSRRDVDRLQGRLAARP